MTTTVDTADRWAFLDSAASSVLLAETLALAVPLRIDDLQRLRGETRNISIRAWADAAVDQVASRSDALQFGGRKGEAAEVFNHLARGLAALAQSSGGVLFAGVHWCVEHPGGISGASLADRACQASGWDTETEPATGPWCTSCDRPALPGLDHCGAEVCRVYALGLDAEFERAGDS